MNRLFEDVYEVSRKVELPDEIKKYIDSLMDKLGDECKAEAELRKKEREEHKDEYEHYIADEKADYESGKQDYMYGDAKKRGLSFEEWYEEHQKKGEQDDYEEALSQALTPFRHYILDSMKKRGIDTRNKYYWD